MFKLTWKRSMLSLVGAGLLAFGSRPSPATAVNGQYNATFYIAGMGGHFAVADITIVPGDPNPLHLNKLDKIEIGDNETHPVHDARIDDNNRKVMFWATYRLDPNTGKVHIGKTDLATGKKILDLDVPVPEGLTHNHDIYCASAQTKECYLPISMTNKAYIDVFRKSDLSRIRTVFLEGTEADIRHPYLFYHGINTPDMKKLLITINEADKAQGRTIGKIDLFLLDMEEIIKGRVKVLAHNLAPGVPERTTSFRQYFSPDGKLLANSGGDCMFLINGETLEPLDVETVGANEENHDAIFTPDGKYIIATSRTKVKREIGAKLSLENPYPNAKQDDKVAVGDEYLMDGQLKLYDVAARKFIGRPTSVCMACHNKEQVEENAVLCGIDANWK